MSRLSVEVTSDPAGGRARTRVSTDGPHGRGHLGARVLTHGPAFARLALVAEGALLLAGDDITIDVRVGPGALLELVEPSGTVAYDMRGGSAQWHVDVHLSEQARLSWHGQPFVIATGAAVTRDIRIELEPGATAQLRETLVLGRVGEQGGVLTQSTRVRCDGHPLLAEDLVLDGSRRQVGVLGPWRVIDIVSLLGRRAPGIPELPSGARRFELDGVGTLVRSLAAEVHEGSLAHVWDSLVTESDRIAI